ncbi:MAG: DUF3185 family protein [Verrucomicrobiota bacterium]
MNKSLSLAFLVGGIVLLVLGISAAESFSSDVSRFFSGSPTNKSVWMMIGGVILTIAGLFGLVRGSKGV